MNPQLSIGGKVIGEILGMGQPVYFLDSDVQWMFENFVERHGDLDGVRYTATEERARKEQVIKRKKQYAALLGELANKLRKQGMPCSLMASNQYVSVPLKDCGHTLVITLGPDNLRSSRPIYFRTAILGTSWRVTQEGALQQLNVAPGIYGQITDVIALIRKALGECFKLTYEGKRGSGEVCRSCDYQFTCAAQMGKADWLKDQMIQHVNPHDKLPKSMSGTMSFYTSDAQLDPGLFKGLFGL